MKIGTLLMLLAPTGIVWAATTTDPVTELFHKFQYTANGANNQTSKIGVVAALPQGTTTSIIAGVIRFLLAICGTIALTSFTFAGILMVTEMGNDEQITKAKKVLLWSVIALAIIAGSYGIVTGVSQLQFNP